MIKPLPPGWAEAALCEVAVITLGQSPPGTSYNDTGIGIPFFQGKAEFGSLYPTIARWTTEPKKHAKKGDILLSVRAPVGPTNLAPCDCAIGRGLHSIRPVPLVDRDFVLWSLRATVHRFHDISTGTTFNAITGQQVKNHRIRIAPAAEQKRIVKGLEEVLSRLDAVESSLTSLVAKPSSMLQINRFKALRQSVLNEAFAGRLVPQDPNDEPASELLERVSESWSLRKFEGKPRA